MIDDVERVPCVVVWRECGDESMGVSEICVVPWTYISRGLRPVVSGGLYRSVSALLSRREWVWEFGCVLVSRDGSEWRIVKVMKGGE